MPPNRLCWMVGGPQGSGVDSAARLFALTAARAGLEVVGQREYYSNIKGKHSYYKILVDEREIHAPIRDVHLLTTYDAETTVRHAWAQQVVPGGVIFYDADHADTTLDKLNVLDKRVKQEIKEAMGEDVTVQDIVDKEKERGVDVRPFPYMEVLHRVGERLGMGESGKLLILKNTVAVAATLTALDFDRTFLEETLRETFAGKRESIIEMNMAAVDEAAKYVNETWPDTPYQLRSVDRRRERMFLSGTDAVGMAKVAAGCRFQSYYPISPATDESVFLEGHPESNVIVVQTEDEIAAINMAIGAALTGARTSTSTSGPGACLMVEGLGWAGICEVPVVLFNYQRGGPSTGLPTRNEQGDLRFMMSSGHGDYPRLVLAPGDVEECFYDTIDAFNWADKYQTPVVVLPDKNVAGNSYTIPPFDMSDVRIDRGKLLTEDDLEDLSEDGLWDRFEFNEEDGISRRSLLGQKGGIHWLTGDEHTPNGHITEDPVIRDRMMEKRALKLETAAKDIPKDRKLRIVGDDDADVTVLVWGSMKGAVLDAMRELDEQGGPSIRMVQVRVMEPFPAEELEEELEGRKVLCIEMNHNGELAMLLRERTGIKVDHLAVKYNGRPVIVDEVMDVVALALKGEERIVLREGV